MDRKKFIRTSGFGMGFALLPGMAIGRDQLTEAELGEGSDPKIINDVDGDVLNVIGDIQTHKLVGNDTNDQLVEWVDNVAPGVGIPPHIHTKEDEIFRVIKGEVEIMIDGKTTVLHEGDIAYAPKNIPHAWKVVGTTTAKMITTAFPAGIEKMFEALSELPDGPPDFNKVATICGNHGINFI